MSSVPTNIILDDGFIEISINSDPNRIIKWNPTDTSFVDRFYKFITFAESIKSRLVAVGEDLPSDAVTFSDDGEATVDPRYGDAGAQITAIGQEVADELDKAFGTSVSKAAFMGANPLSPSYKNGQYLFVNFIATFEPIITKSFSDAAKAREKYTAPFKKKW